MSKKNHSIENPYDHSDLPKVKNIFVHIYRCFMKIFAIAVFGIGAVILAIFVFPFIRLFSGKKKDFGIVARAYVSHTFRIFLSLLRDIILPCRKHRYDPPSPRHCICLPANRRSPLPAV